MAKDVKNTASEGKANKKAGELSVEEKKTAEPVAVKKEEPKTKAAEASKVQPKKEVKDAVPVKKPAGKTQKAEKESLVPELFVQYNDDPAGAQEANVNDIVEKVKAAYVAEGHRESSIKTLKVYMKPQEWKAYYVINNKIEGQIDLF